MTWAPLLLTLLTPYTVSVAQAGLTQPSSVTKSLRQTATLTCTGNSNNVGNQGAAWLQQLPGQAPKLLTYRNNNRPSGVSERFSSSRSGSVSSLSISELKPEDEADYYCSAWDSSLNACTVLQACGEVRQTLAVFPEMGLP
uniref:Ig-like domain-containing protein n=1 Tax=Rhinolophus ferrumequinum TaxID=59479 RepID=A0A671FWN8_RHIFE